MEKNNILFALSNEIDKSFQVQVVSVEGQFRSLYTQSQLIENPRLSQLLSRTKYNFDLFVTVQVYDGGEVPLTSEVQTSYVSFENLGLDEHNSTTSNGNGVSTMNKGQGVQGENGAIQKSYKYKRMFSQWMDLPLNYSQLPLTATLRFRVYEYVDSRKSLFGVSSVELFNKVDGTLLSGLQLLKIDLSPVLSQGVSKKEFDSELRHLEEIMKKYETIQSESHEREEWLNALIAKKIEELNRKLVLTNMGHFYLNIELSKFDVKVIFNDFEYTNNAYAIENSKYKSGVGANHENLKLAGKMNTNSLNSSLNLANPNFKRQGNDKKRPGFQNKNLEELIDVDAVNDNSSFSVDTIYDPEQYNTQPIESKYHQLERASLSKGNNEKANDKTLKPSLEIKKKLQKILSYSSIQSLDVSDKNLIFKFRYYLINNYKLNSSLNANFLNFLLKSISWENSNEIIEIQEILNSLMVNKIKISLTDTLELLGPSFTHNTLVRNFAVNNLKYFKDEDLNLYLLQLVQALKFDDYLIDGNGSVNVNGSTNNTTNNSTVNMNTSNDYYIVDVNSREEMTTMYKNLKYNKNSGPFDSGANLMIGGSEFLENSNFQSNDPDVSKYNLEDALSPLANFLIYKSIHNKELGNFFYWYIKVELRDQENELKHQLIYRKISKTFVKNLKVLQSYKDGFKKIKRSRTNSIDSDLGLADLTASEELETGNANSVNDDYLRTFKNNVSKIFDAGGNKKKTHIEMTGNEFELNELLEQISFVKKISQLTSLIKNLKKSRPEKQEFLKTYLTKNETNYKYYDPKNETPLTLPLSPDVKILYVIAEQCTVFKSSLSPLKLTFKTLPREVKNGDGKISETYSFMYKVGDDLRQDQLVIQIIKLIEKLLNDENLNLKLNPYRILATDLSEGMIEFVPNLTLDKILSDYSNILNFFKQENPYKDEAEAEVPESHIHESISKELVSTYNIKGNVTINTTDNLENNLAEAINGQSDDILEGVHPKIMDNFVKSCAGYCVITYLLGIGDRHLDNLLICQNGMFFHVDFGYILGRDPKPFPPLMKLPIEIVDGFGGLNSKYFNDFKNYCFVCFLTLRKNSNLMLNLLELMTSSSIPDLTIDPKNAILKVQEKFMLELSDEEAIVFFQNLINDSVNAFLPVVIDKLHSLAQYWRS